MVDAMYLGWIERKSVKDRRQQTGVDLHPSLAFIIIFLRLPISHCRVWNLENRTVEWALGKPAHSLARVFVLYHILSQQNTAAIPYPCPRYLPVLQLAEGRRNWVCYDLGRHQVQCQTRSWCWTENSNCSTSLSSCLIVQEALSRPLGLLVCWLLL